MKSYLNKEERETFIKVATMTGYIEDLANMDFDTQNERKYFRSALTALNKASVHLINRLDSKFAAQLQREMRNNEIIIVSNSRAKMELEESEKTKEAVDLMAEKALYWCCECEEKNKKECLLAKAFRGLNIPEYDKKQECPYEIIRD